LLIQPVDRLDARITDGSFGARILRPFFLPDGAIMTSFARAEVKTTEPREACLAIRAMFLICGTVVASWAPQVPLAKTRLGLDDGMLGLTLLGLGAGAMVAMPLSGLLAARFSSRLITTLGGLVICLTMTLIILAPDAPLLALALFLFGAATGSMEVAMNIQGTAVEALGVRPMMSSFHGMFSCGGLLGAGGTSLLARPRPRTIARDRGRQRPNGGTVSHAGRIVAAAGTRLSPDRAGPDPASRPRAGARSADLRAVAGRRRRARLECRVHA
jgi:hypothetical protein